MRGWSRCLHRTVLPSALPRQVPSDGTLWRHSPPSCPGPPKCAVLCMAFHAPLLALCPLSFVCLFPSVQPLPSAPGTALAAHPGARESPSLCSLPFRLSVSSPALHSVHCFGLSWACSEDTQTKLCGHPVPSCLGTFSLLLSLSPPVSGHANPKGSGGHLPGTRPLLPVPMGVWG